MMELRCKGKLHGIVVRGGSGLIEVKCRSKWCGAEPSKTIIHQFDIATGKHITKEFKKG